MWEYEHSSQIAMTQSVRAFVLAGVLKRFVRLKVSLGYQSQRGVYDSPLLGYDEKSVPVCSDDSGGSEGALLVHVLMPVQHPPRYGAGYIRIKRAESDVDFVIAVVDESWRVVRHKDIHARKRSQSTFDI